MRNVKNVRFVTKHIMLIIYRYVERISILDKIINFVVLGAGGDMFLIYVIIV
jgi:hypothetical protein